jgi:hypothetical protein
MLHAKYSQKTFFVKKTKTFLQSKNKIKIFGRIKKIYG